MNKNAIYILILLAVQWQVNTAQAQWTTVGSAGFSAGMVENVSFTTDYNGNPYVVFKDVANSYKATVMRFNGSNWVNVGPAGLSAGSVVYTSIAIDTGNTPYIAFTDGFNPYKASVMRFNGSNWVNVGGAGLSAGSANYISLVFDSKNTPYISYMDGANSNKATVMKFNGSSWVNVGSPAFSAGVANYIFLAFDRNDTPYVAYGDGGYSSKATVMKYNGSNWANVGGAGFTGDWVAFTSLAFDKNNTPYLAYQDAANLRKASVVKFNGNSWVNVGSAGFSGGRANDVNIAFDNNDVLYIAFTDYSNSQKATLMKFNGSSWVNVDNPGFSASGVRYTSLAIDGTNTPYVAFQDHANSSKATVMKYELPNTWNGTSWSKGTPDSTANVTIASNTAPATFSCNDLTISSGYSLNTGTNNVVTIHGNLANEGNGVTGTGTLNFTKNGTATLSGDTIEHAGTIIVESGCTLATSNKLKLTSDATNTGRIGASTGTITGNVYVQRYMPGKRCFRFYGHPFSSSIALSQLTDEIDITGSGGAANGFTATTTNNPSAFYWDVSIADNSTTGANPGWQPFTSANTNSWDRYELLRLMVRGGKGEGLSGGSYTPSAATFEAAGEVNQGTQVITLTKGSNSDFVACGNPYPSPVQMNTIARGSNVGANYYAWDATSGMAGAYVTNAWTLDFKLPAYSAFFTTVSANSSNTLTFEEQDKEATGAGMFKTTTPQNWVELLIYDSVTKWDRLLINLDDNALAVEDNLDGKKLYNPGLDFFTLSKDSVRLAVDVRPYNDGASIPLGLTAYNRYNRYVIRTGMFDIPAGTKLYLYDKYLNKTEELKAGYEYWFDVSKDTASQGNNRFEINMVGQPTNGISTTDNVTPRMQLIPNPAREEVKVSFDKLEGTAQLKLTNITGQVIFSREINTATGSISIPLGNIAAGVYIAEIQSKNARFTEKLIKE